MHTDVVELIDTSGIYYSSYYIEGFYQLAETRPNLSVKVSLNIPPRLKRALRDNRWQHLLFAMCLFRIQTGQEERLVCIDTHDVNSLDVESQTEGYHLPLLESVDIYYKVNFNASVIADTPQLSRYADKILPIAQFSPIKVSHWLPFTRRLLKPMKFLGLSPGLRHDQPYLNHFQDALQRLRHLKNFETLSSMLAMREQEKDIDLFFVTSYRAHPRHAEVMDNRYNVITELKAQTQYNVEAGFTAFGPLPDHYQSVQMPRLNQMEYLDRISRSKIVVYTRGIADCISSKFLLFMVSGCVVVGEPIANNLKMLQAFPHLQEQFGFTSAPGIIAKVLELLAADHKRHELADLNMRFFDQWLSPVATAQRMLTEVTAAEAGQ